MKSIWLAAAFVLLLGGCVQNYSTSLVLTPPPPRMKVAGAETVGLKVSVADNRVDKTNIGKAHTSDGSSTWVLVPTQPVEEVVAKGVEAELKARGFSPGDGPAFLLVDIRQADCQAIMVYMGLPKFSADVLVAAQVVDAEGRQLYSNTYQGSREKGGNMFNSFGSARVHLQEVLAGVIRDMGEDGRLIQALFEASRAGK